MRHRFWQPCEGSGLAFEHFPDAKRGDDQGFEEALMALWAAATRATGTR